jgi:hypothetical protein
LRWSLAPHVCCLSARKVATVLVGHIISTTQNYLISTTQNYLSALDDGLLVGLPPTRVGPATVALLSIFFLQSEAVDAHLLFAAVEIENSQRMAILQALLSHMKNSKLQHGAVISSTDTYSIFKCIPRVHFRQSLDSRYSISEKPRFLWDSLFVFKPLIDILDPPILTFHLSRLFFFFQSEGEVAHSISFYPKNQYII